MINYKVEIRKILARVTGVKNPEVEFSASEQFGDYSSNVVLKNKDLDIDKIIKKLNEENSDFIAEKKGKFINFWLKKDILVNNLISKDIDIKKNNGVVIIDYYWSTQKFFIDKIGHHGENDSTSVKSCSSG